jgi:hypothetical protein
MSFANSVNDTVLGALHSPMSTSRMAYERRKIQPDVDGLLLGPLRKLAWHRCKEVYAGRQKLCRWKFRAAKTTELIGAACGAT